MEAALAAVLSPRGRSLRVHPGAVREQADVLARLAVFGDEPDRALARWALRVAAPELGAWPASTARLYAARGRGEIGGFTTPAVNIRGMTYDVARALFRAMHASDCGAAIFEINRAEIGFTAQSPAEFSAVVLAAAIAEDYRGPVVIQGDHFQANARQFAANPAGETAALEALVREAVAAGFFCIDIDASTLVDLGHATVAEQQAANIGLTARLAALVGEIEPVGVHIAVGGEIGEVGSTNSTVEELTTYVDGVQARLGTTSVLAKVSVQTGTTHGGVPLPDGSIASVALDFETLRAISAVARDRYGMAGAVQHGASTLPDELFHRFPQVETAEVHLATGFQNLVLDHDAFPAPLRDAMHRHALTAFGAERQEGEADRQFVYRLRRKSWGAFKREVWDIPAPARAAIGADLKARFRYLFEQLGVSGSAATVERYVKPVSVDVPPPAAS